MPATFGPLIKAVLRANDCYFVRHAKGDHELWYSPITDLHVTVDSGAKSRHTANAVMKRAGIDHRF